MGMEGNPFCAMNAAFQEEARKSVPVFYRMGEVSRASPLTVNIAGHDFSGKELLVNPDIGDLQVGDRVYVVPGADDSQFYVLCKLVSP